MSAEPPPSDSNGGYNPDDWVNPNAPVDEQYLAQNYLQFPNAQGSETLGDAIISGTLTAQDLSTFSDLATFNNGIDISTTAGVKFSDDTVQTTAFIEANYAQLNTDNTFLAPYQNTFAGNASTGNANAPIKISNVSSGEYGTLYVDPNPNSDLTLYSNQGNSGGLTVRNATNSYTINPATINGTNNWANFLNPINSSLGINAGYVNINGTSSSTLNVYAPSSTINYTQIRQENSSSTVIANSYWDGTNGGGIFFQFKSSSTDYGCPFYLTPTLVQCYTPLQCTSAITATQFTTGLTTITQSLTLNPQIVSFTNSYNGLGAPQFYFQMQNASNTGYFAPLQIVNTGITASVPITIPYNGVYPQTNSYTVANIAYVNDGLYYKAPLASPAFTGNPTATTQPTTDNSTRLATTEYVKSVIPNTSGFATLTGNNNFTGTNTINSSPIATLANGGSTLRECLLTYDGGSGGSCSINPMSYYSVQTPNGTNSQYLFGSNAGSITLVLANSFIFPSWSWSISANMTQSAYATVNWGTGTGITIYRQSTKTTIPVSVSMQNNPAPVGYTFTISILTAVSPTITAGEVFIFNFTQLPLVYVAN